MVIFYHAVTLIAVTALQKTGLQICTNFSFLSGVETSCLTTVTADQEDQLASVNKKKKKVIF